MRPSTPSYRLDSARRKVERQRLDNTLAAVQAAAVQAGRAVDFGTDGTEGITQ